MLASSSPKVEKWWWLLGFLVLHFSRGKDSLHLRLSPCLGHGTGWFVFLFTIEDGCYLIFIVIFFVSNEEGEVVIDWEFRILDEGKWFCTVLMIIGMLCS